MKHFVLDTNVVLFEADSIFKFEEHSVVIPITVIEEVDHFKKEQNELGRNARRFARYLDELRAVGELTKGVPLNELGGSLRIHLVEEVKEYGLDWSVMDNRILTTAISMAKDGLEAVMVTKDVNLRIKADAYGVKAEDYENSKVDVDELYSGVREIEVSGEFVSSIHANGGLMGNPHGLFPNEFVIYKDEENPQHTAVLRYHQYIDRCLPLKSKLEAWGLTPKNLEQQMAMELLLDDSVKLVTLMGKSGSGKSLVSVGCGLRKVTDEYAYRKLTVARPIIGVGAGLGYLPGDLAAKLNVWMAPIHDAVEYLMAGYPISDNKPEPPVKTKGKKAPKKYKEEEDEEKVCGLMSKGYMELVDAGILNIEALHYIRGRSIPNQFILIDEAQQTTKHEIKSILTRASEGTKIVLTGDVEQIDTPYLDAESNGLSYVIDRFREEGLAGHITMVKCERSLLATRAAELL